MQGSLQAEHEPVAPRGVEESKEIDGRSDAKTEDESDDPMENFKTVFEAIHLDAVPDLAISIRRKLFDCRNDTQKEVFQSATVSLPPLTGSYHILFLVIFNDGLQWLLKVPGIGVKGNWDDLASESLSSEALTMQLLLRETTIPIPRVWEFSASLENPLGVPFILMEFIEGLSSYDVWFDDTVTEDELETKRTRTLEDVAKAMVQLSKFSFDRGGSLRFDIEGKPSYIGPSRVVDNHKMLARLSEGDENNDPLYAQCGPYDSTKSFFFGRLANRPEPRTDWRKQDLAWLNFFLKSIPEQSEDTKPFVLAHPDLNFQNVLVSQDGHLQAMIDWDGVAAVPRSIGNESYPSWLTRDWDPVMYAWKEDVETDSAPEHLREDPPAVLQYYRTKYASFIQSFKSQDNAVHRSRPDTTFQSLVMENLLIAIEDSICTHDILENLFNKTVAAGRLGTEDNDVEAFDYWDMADSLRGGNLSQRCEEFLRKGFDAILAGREPV